MRRFGIMDALELQISSQMWDLQTIALPKAYVLTISYLFDHPPRSRNYCSGFEMSGANEMNWPRHFMKICSLSRPEAHGSSFVSSLLALACSKVETPF